MLENSEKPKAMSSKRLFLQTERSKIRGKYLHLTVWNQRILTFFSFKITQINQVTGKLIQQLTTERVIIAALI